MQTADQTGGRVASIVVVLLNPADSPEGGGGGIAGGCLGRANDHEVSEGDRHEKGVERCLKCYNEGIE